MLVRSPWVGAQEVAADLFTPAVVPAHPAALALGAADGAAAAGGTGGAGCGDVLLPASEFGRAGMDELHQQTVNLLSFQSIPRETFDAQLAYNLLCGFGENAKASLLGIDGRIRRAIRGPGGKTAAGAGYTDDQCAGVSRSSVFHIRGVGAAGRFVGA